MLQATTTSEPNYADVHEVAEFASTLTIAYLLCRELGHNWRPWTARSINGGYERALRCTRCHTERWEVLSSTGAKIKGHYVYPEDYLHAGLGRIVGDGRDALRLESLTRAITDSEERASA